MANKEDKSLHKIFIIKVFSSLSKIETAINAMALVDNSELQLSILGQYSSLNTNSKNTLKRIFSTVKQEFNAFMGNTFQFGFFNHPEYGKLFIAGHLTPTFLTKVDKRKLATLPAGLIGIFRELGLNEKETKNYLTKVNEEKFCLILRVERRKLNTINTLLEPN